MALEFELIRHIKAAEESGLVEGQRVLQGMLDQVLALRRTGILPVLLREREAFAVTPHTLHVDTLHVTIPGLPDTFCISQARFMEIAGQNDVEGTNNALEQIVLDRYRQHRKRLSEIEMEEAAQKEIVTQSLGAFLKERRLINSITQSKLAEQAGIRSGSIISLAETDRYSYRPEVLSRVFEALGLGVDEEFLFQYSLSLKTEPEAQLSTEAVSESLTVSQPNTELVQDANETFAYPQEPNQTEEQSLSELIKVGGELKI